MPDSSDPAAPLNAVPSAAPAEATGKEAPGKEAAGKEATSKIERNWSELLQEFRVVQTGTQILTGFLLTLPFQARFGSLSADQTALYLGLVVGAAVATTLALAPVAVHRLLFRHGAKAEIVAIGNRLALVALGVVAVVLTGTVAFVFDVVVGVGAGVAAGVAAAVLIASIWVALPLSIRPGVIRAAAREAAAGHPEAPPAPRMHQP